MDVFKFEVTKGQIYNLTITPAIDDNSAGSLTAPPSATAADPTEFELGAITLNADGLTYNLPATALKSGTSAININAVGASALTAEADGTVPLPLATKLLLSGPASGTP